MSAHTLTRPLDSTSLRLLRSYSILMTNSYVITVVYQYARLLIEGDANGILVDGAALKDVHVDENLGA